MANTTGTTGGVGSQQGGQQGWEDGEQTQPIPPSREGTTSAGMTGEVYDPSQGGDIVAKAQTDKEREAEEAKDREGVTKEEEAPAEVPADDNFGLPEGVSTSASRGENEPAEEAEVEAEPEA